MLPAPVQLPAKLRPVKSKGAMRLFMEEVATAGQPGCTYRYATARKGGAGVNRAVQAELGVKVSACSVDENGNRDPGGALFVFVTKLTPVA